MLKFLSISIFFTLLLSSCGGGGGSGSGSSSNELVYSDYEISFHVTDDYRLIADVLESDGITPVRGIEVSFSFVQNQSGSTLDIIDSRTMADGTAQAVFHPGNEPGLDLVEVFADRAKALVSLRIDPQGEIIEEILLTADPYYLNTSRSSSISIQGKFTNSQPAANEAVRVYFVANNSNGVLIYQNQNLQRVNLNLDGQGKASLTYRAGNTPGLDAIMAIFN